MDIRKLEQIILSSQYLVFFGGAGVSTESGLKDFRSQDGLYSEFFLNERPEKILSRTYFFNETENFYSYYKEKFLKPLPEPNQAHHVLSMLENMGILKAIITQNIDGLHQMAGSKKVIELHGSIHRNYALHSKTFYPGFEFILNSKSVPRTESGELIKPDVVLYEEPLDDQVVRQAVDEIKKADVLIVGGTSLTVYPAAGFIRFFNGKHLIIINREPGHGPYYLQGSIGEIFSQIKLDSIKST